MVHTPKQSPLNRAQHAYPRALSGVCFISDLHLSDNMPRTLVQFEFFCNTIAPDFKALIILGDLFEYWLGDDTADNNATAQRVITALTRLKQRGVFIGFMAGNRDFLLRSHFARRAGMVILPDPCVLSINGQNTLLTHGDLLCTLDTGYQRFRKLVHTSLIQKLFLSSPISWRNSFAKKLRKNSKTAPTKNNPAAAAITTTDKLDVPAQEAANWFKQYAVRFIIHGHTHKPSTHLTFDTTRLVLPDWDCENKEQTRWGYISWQDGTAMPLLITKHH